MERTQKYTKKTFVVTAIILLLVLFCSVANVLTDDKPVQVEPTPTIDLKLPEEIENISELLEPVRASHKLPAMAAAIVTRDGVKAVGIVGVRKKGDAIPVKLEDAFHLGSCTKAMTATLAMMLIEEGKLQADLTLEEAFPEFKQSMDPAYRKVTLEQLLAHQAGFSDNPWPVGMSFGEVHNLPGNAPRQRMEYVRRILSEKPAADPGTKQIYTNRGYTVAGCIIERTMEKPWEELMNERLFGPLGMSTAGFGAMGNPGKVDQPWQHRIVMRINTPVEPGPRSDNPPALAPAGTVHCSIQDWARFIQFHLLAGKASEEIPALLKSDSFGKIHAPYQGSDYGWGWVFTDRGWGGGEVMTHAGSNNQNYAVVWMAPKKGFAVIVATNAGGGSSAEACDEAAGALISLYQNKLQQ